jgi:16S rRNA processing protein RimM
MQKVFVGQIVATSGIKGYVRIHTSTEEPLDIMTFQVLYNEEDRQFKLKRFISSKGTIAIVEIEGINSIDIAKTLIGTELFANREQFDQLPSGSYYYIDVIGCKVYIEQEEYGEVIDLVNYGASDIIEIRELKTNKLVMYPFTDDFIFETNIDEKIIVLKEKISL